MKIKQFLLQFAVIMLVSAAIALGYNYLSTSPLPIFKKYVPDPEKETGQDLSNYYVEVDVETLRSLIEADMAVLLDARTRENFNTGHLPKAISLPIGEFNEKYDKTAGFLAGDKSIVIYCIGVNCIDSALLAKELHQKGYRDIYVYKGGIEEWQALGYPVEKPQEGEKVN